MRSFIRHPSDIPLEVRPERSGVTVREQLRDVSFGGLSFGAAEPLVPGAIIRLTIGYVRPPFEVRGRVTWCERERGRYLIGVAFLDPDDGYRARMVEQVCHIEHYRREVLQREGRRLSGAEAAREWIERFARYFPEPETTGR